MKKILQILKNISTASLICASITTVVSLSSCKPEKNKIEKINIVAQKQALSPGESSQLLISYQPRTAPKPNISWEILDLPESLKSKVAIDETGKISVQSTATVEGQYIEIHVKASVADQTEVTDTKAIYIIPPGTTGFIGFENEEIKYIDAAHNEASIKIIQNEPKKYETDGDINLFLGRHEYLPGWKAPIQFTPIFTPGPEIDRNMQFYQDRHFEVPEITWETYTEGNDTDEIPNFWGTNDTYPKTYIKVKFAVDSDVELKINFRIWQERSQETLARMLYYPDPEKQDDNYEIKLQGEAEYICNLYCPIKTDPEDKTIFSDELSYIICHAGVREFAEYEVVWDMSLLDSRLKDAFKITPHETQSKVRDYDLLPYWITGFEYQFDLSKMSLTADWEFQSMQLFRLSLHDKWDPNPKHMSGWCTFSVEWIDNEP